MIFEIYLREIYFRFLYSCCASVCSFGILFYYKKELLLRLLVVYLVDIQKKFQYTNLLEVFYIELKLVGLISLVILIILIYLNFLIFSLNGLYLNEFIALIYKNLKIFTVNFFLYKLVLINFVKLIVYYFLHSFDLESNILQIRFDARIQEIILFIISSYFLYFLVVVVFYILFSRGVFIKKTRYLLYITLFFVIVIFIPSDFYLHLCCFILGTLLIEALIFNDLIRKLYQGV